MAHGVRKRLVSSNLGTLRRVSFDLSQALQLQHMGEIEELEQYIEEIEKSRMHKSHNRSWGSWQCGEQET